MDNREQQQQNPDAQQEQRKGPSIRVESITEVRHALHEIEDRLKGGSRVPFKGNVRMVNIDDLLELTSRVSTILPEALREACDVLSAKQKIERDANARAQEKLNQATNDASARHQQAEAEAKRLVEDAQQRAAEIERQARAAAERLLAQANADALRLVEESEIVRRANARAKEIYDQVQMDVNGVYSKAYNDVNLLLSGATAALNHSAIDLANIRDKLLGSFGEQEGR